MKKLIPSLCLLLISAILMGTSTYAWFSMNTQVTASGMQVKAVAEDGLLINYVTTVGDSNWSDNANTASTAINLTPASTENVTNWYHNHSKKSANATDYVSTSWSALTITENATAAVAGTSGGYSIGQFADNGATKNAYVKYVYYIKSSAAAITLGSTQTFKELDVDEITITGQTAAGLDLCKALRVGVKQGTALKVFAPFSGATASYNVGGSSTAYAPDGVGTITDAANATVYEADTNLLTTGTIPAVDSDSPMEIDIFVWFEGEDANCKSDNTDVLNSLTISVSFNLETTAD